VSTYSYGTFAGSGYGFTITPSTGDERPRTPSGLIATQAVQTKDGWRGQVIVDKEIDWEGEPAVDGESAVGEANARVVRVIRALFVEVGGAS